MLHNLEHERNENLADFKLKAKNDLLDMSRTNTSCCMGFIVDELQLLLQHLIADTRNRYMYDSTVISPTLLTITISFYRITHN